MDVIEYINSGIIESYVIGSTSDQERREVECMSAIYPEIKEEITNTQVAFEKYSKSIAITPPAHIKSNVLKAIKNTKQQTNLTVVKNTEKTPVKASSTNFYKSFSIAASIALIFSFGYSLYNYNLTNKLENDLLAAKNEIQTTTDFYASTLNSKEQTKQFLLNPETKLIALNGTKISPESNVRIYWNKADSKAILVNNNLPKTTEANQYQLWAIVKGVPVSLGVLNNNQKAEVEIKLNDTDIDAFAITLEKQGGSPTPNLEQLYVIGNTQS